MITAEQRMLLEGDIQREARNLPKMGWGDVTSSTSISPRMQGRILQIREALIEKRSIPAPSAKYIAEARAFASQLFPLRAKQTADEKRAATAKRTGVSIEGLIDAEFRAQAAKQAAEIAASRPPVLSDDELLYLRRKNFPQDTV
jgi:hypothetical protein